MTIDGTEGQSFEHEEMSVCTDYRVAKTIWTQDPHSATREALLTPNRVFKGTILY